MSKRRRISPPGGWGSIQTPEEPSNQPSLFAPPNENPELVEPVANDQVDLANPAPTTSAPEMGQPVPEEPVEVSEREVLNQAQMVGFQAQGLQPLDGLVQRRQGVRNPISIGTIGASTPEELDNFSLELKEAYANPYAGEPQQIIEVPGGFDYFSPVEEGAEIAVDGNGNPMWRFVEYEVDSETGNLMPVGPALHRLFNDPRYHKHLARSNRVVVERQFDDQVAGTRPVVSGNAGIYFPNRANIEDFDAGRSRAKAQAIPDDRRALYSDASSEFSIALNRAYEDTGDITAATRSWRDYFRAHSEDHLRSVNSDAQRILAQYRFVPTDEGLKMTPLGVNRDTIQRSISTVRQAPAEMEAAFPEFTAGIAPVVAEASRSFMQAVYNAERVSQSPITIKVNGEPLVTYFSDQNAERALDIETAGNRIEYDSLGLLSKGAFSSILSRLIPETVQSGQTPRPSIIDALIAAPGGDKSVVSVPLTSGNVLTFESSKEALTVLSRQLRAPAKSAELIRNNIISLQEEQIPNIVQSQAAIVPSGSFAEQVRRTSLRRALIKQRDEYANDIVEVMGERLSTGRLITGYLTPFYDPRSRLGERKKKKIGDLSSRIQAIDYLLGQSDLESGAAIQVFNEQLEQDAAEFERRVAETGQISSPTSEMQSPTELILREFVEKNADSFAPTVAGRFPATVLDAVRKASEETLGAPIQDLPEVDLEEEEALKVVGSPAELDRFGNPVVVLPEESLLQNPNKRRNSANLPRVDLSDQQALRQWMNHINRTSLTPVDDIYQHFSTFTGYDFVSPKEFEYMEAPGWSSRFFQNLMVPLTVPMQGLRTSLLLAKESYGRFQTGDLPIIGGMPLPSVNAGREQMFEQIFDGFDFLDDPNAEAKAREVATKYYDAAVLGRGALEAAIENRQEIGVDLPFLPEFNFSILSPHAGWAMSAALSEEERTYLAQYAGEDTSLTWKMLNSQVAQEGLETIASMVFDPLMYSAVGRNARYIQSGDNVYVASPKFNRTAQELAILGDRAGITSVSGESGFAQLMLDMEVDLSKLRNSDYADEAERLQIVERVRKRTEVLHDVQVGTGKRVVSLRRQAKDNLRAADEIQKTGVIPEEGAAAALREQAEAMVQIAQRERDQLGTLLDPADELLTEADRVRHGQAIRAAERKLEEAQALLSRFDDPQAAARVLRNQGKRQAADANTLEQTAKRVDYRTRLLRGSQGTDGSFSNLDAYLAGERSLSALGLKKRELGSDLSFTRQREVKVLKDGERVGEGIRYREFSVRSEPRTAEEFLMGSRRAPRVAGTQAAETVAEQRRIRQRDAADRMRAYREDRPKPEGDSLFGLTHWLRKTELTVNEIDDALRLEQIRFDDLTTREKWLYFAYKTGSAPTKLPGWFLDSARKSFGTTAMQPLLDPATGSFLRRVPDALWQQFQQALRQYHLKSSALESELLVEINRVTETSVRVLKEIRAAAPDKIKRAKKAIIESEVIKKTSTNADEISAAEYNIARLEREIANQERYLQPSYTPQVLLLDAANEIETGAGMLMRRPELVAVAAQIDELVARYADNLGMEEESIRQLLVLIKRQLNIDPEVLANVQDQFALLQKLSLHPETVANERILQMRRVFTEAANERAAFRNVMRSMSSDTLASLLEKVRLEILGKPVDEADLSWVSRAVADVFKDQPGGLTAFNNALMSATGTDNIAMAMRKLATYMQDTKYGRKWTSKSAEITVEAVRNAALRLDAEAEAIDRFLLGEMQDYMLGDLVVGRRSSVDELRAVTDLLANEHYVNAQAIIGSEKWDEFLAWSKTGDAPPDTNFKTVFLAARSHMERHNMFKNLVPNEIAREQTVLSSLIDTPEATILKSKIQEVAGTTRISPTELDALLRISDARSISWALETGRSPSEWWTATFADVKMGRGRLPADTLYQYGGPEYLENFYSSLIRYVDSEWPTKRGVEKELTKQEVTQLMTSKRSQQGIKAQERADLEVELITDELFADAKTITKDEFMEALNKEKLPFYIDTRISYRDPATGQQIFEQQARERARVYSTSLMEFILDDLAKNFEAEGLISVEQAAGMKGLVRLYADDFVEELFANKSTWQGVEGIELMEMVDMFVGQKLIDDLGRMQLGDVVDFIQQAPDFAMDIRVGLAEAATQYVDEIVQQPTNWSSVKKLRDLDSTNLIPSSSIDLALTLPGGEVEYEFLFNVDGYRLDLDVLTSKGRGPSIKTGDTYKKESHFKIKEGDSNIIHVRATVRTVEDANGNKVRTLHVAEIQSDLHQDAKTYFDSQFDIHAKKLNKAFAENETTVRVVRSERDGELIGWNIEDDGELVLGADGKPKLYAKGERHAYQRAVVEGYKRYEESSDHISAYWRWLEDLIETGGYKRSDLPDGPLKSTWLATGIRLAVAKAAELGLDGVSFDTARTNIYRYHRNAFDVAGQPVRFDLGPRGEIISFGPRTVLTDVSSNPLGDAELSRRLLTYSEAEFTPQQQQFLDFIERPGGAPSKADELVAEAVYDALLYYNVSDIVGYRIGMAPMRLPAGVRLRAEQTYRSIVDKTKPYDTDLRVAVSQEELSGVYDFDSFAAYSDNQLALVHEEMASHAGSEAYILMRELLADFDSAIYDVAKIAGNRIGDAPDELLDLLFDDIQRRINVKSFWNDSFYGFIKPVMASPEDMKKVMGVPGARGHVVSYDTAMPKTVNKLYKKDGLKLEPGTTRVPPVDDLAPADMPSALRQDLAEYYRRSIGSSDYSVSQGSDVGVRLLKFSDEFKAKILEDGQPLYQVEDAVKKGAVRFLTDGRAIMYLFKNADASTFIHEMGHILRRQLPDAELRAIEEFAGAKDGFFTVAAEEKFARAFERFVLEHVVPEGAPEDLIRALNLIKTSMQGIYENLFGVSGSPIDIEISDEVRNIFVNLIHGTPVNERLARKIARETVAGRKDASKAVVDAKIKGRSRGPFVRDSAAFMRLEEAVRGSATEVEAIGRVRQAFRSMMGEKAEVPEIARWIERYSKRVGSRLFSVGPDSDRTKIIKDLQRVRDSVVDALKKSDDLSGERLLKKEASIRRAVNREAKAAPSKMDEILAQIDDMFTLRLPKGDGTSGQFVIELNDWQRNLWSDFNELTKNLTERDKSLAAFTALRDSPTTPEGMKKMWAALERDLGFEPGVAQQWSVGARLQASKEELEPVVGELRNLIKRYEALYEKHGMDFMANPTVMLQQWGVVDYFPHVIVDGASITTPRGSLRASGSIEAGRRQVENSRRPVSFGEMLSATMDAERRRENLGTIREINMMLESGGEFGVEPLHLAARYLQANRKISAQDLLFTLIDTGVIRPIFPRTLADGTTASAAKVAQDTGYVPIFERGSDSVQRYSREQILFATRKELAELGITDPATLDSILDPRSGSFFQVERFAEWSKEAVLVRKMEAIEDTIAIIRYTELKGGAAKLTDVRALVKSALELDTVEAQDAALKALAETLKTKATTVAKTPRFGPDDLRTYFAEGQEAFRLYIPRQVQVAMNDIITADFARSGELKALTDRIQNFFKARLTILAIAFHSRNAVSNVVQSMMNLSPAEVLSPSANIYAGTLATGVAHFERYGGMRKARDWFAASRREGESAAAFTARKTRGAAFERTYGRLIDEGVDLGDGKKIDIDEAYRILKDNGVLSESFTQYVDIADVESSLVSMMVNHGIEGKIGTAKKIASATEDALVVTLPTLITGGIPVTLPKSYGAAVGRVVENQARILNFRGGMKTGLNYADSSAEVARFLFDYSDLTAFQKQWMRTFFPFFTWNNKNFWLQLEQIYKYPAYFSMFNHLVYEGLPNIANAAIEQEFGVNTVNPNDISQVRGRERHAFSRISMPVPGYQNVYLEGFGLPQEAFQEYIGPFVESFQYLRENYLSAFNGTDYKSEYWNYSDRKPFMRILGQGNIPTRIILEAMTKHHSFYDKPISEITNGRVIGDTIDALSQYGSTGEMMAEYLKNATGYNIVQMRDENGFIKDVPIVTGTQNWLVGTMPWGRILKQAAAYTDTVSISHAADMGAAASAGAFNPAFGGGYTTEIPVMLRALEALTGFRITQRNPVWERRIAQKRLRDFMNDQYRAKKLIVETEFEMGAKPFQ